MIYICSSYGSFELKKQGYWVDGAEPSVWFMFETEALSGQVAGMWISSGDQAVISWSLPEGLTIQF